MYNSALYGMVIYCIGCVIPTPLDRAPAQQNFQPAFVTSRVSPAFGPTSEPINSGITFALAATDPNHDDVLTVHLFEGTPAAKAVTASVGISANEYRAGSSPAACAARASVRARVTVWGRFGGG